MAEVRNEYSDYVKYVLQREEISTLPLENEPEGWEDDGLEIVRNKKYHGIVTQFTNGLKFRRHAKEFINDAYLLGGINTNLYLIKYVLQKRKDYKITLGVANEVSWTERYRGLADFNTMKIKDGALSINFNSDELEQLIKSHESDDIEIERQVSFDNKPLGGSPEPALLGRNNVVLTGRTIEAVGSHVNFAPTATGTGRTWADYQWEDLAQPGKYYHPFTVPTEFVIKGFERHVEVTNVLFDKDDHLAWQANFFYNDSEEYLLTSGVTVNIKEITAKVFHALDSSSAYVELHLGFYSFGNNTYQLQSSIKLKSWAWNSYDTYSGSIPIPTGSIYHTTALTLEFRIYDLDDAFPLPYKPICWIDKWDVEITETTNMIENTVPHKFSFINEVASRLMEVISGNKYKFYSKVFGRDVSGFPPPSTGVFPQYQDYDYAQDGEWGNVGLIHGMSVRKFNSLNELYKPLTTSLKNLIESLQATFNIGVGVEPSEHGQRLRFEKLEHFYRDSVVIKLPEQITKVSREVVPAMFYSAIKMGFSKGGDYEMGLGLDEPNVQSDYVSPLRKTDKKYTKISKYRSDDIGMELLRRKPAFLDQTADMSGDDHLWLLDLKLIVGDWIYEQLHWSDDLQSIPTGISHPDSYKSWEFTPKRSLLRHDWVLRAGLENGVNINSRISRIASNSNINLETHKIGETLAVSEAEDVLVRDLNRSRLLPEKIKFTHQIDDDLMDWILGTTKVEIGGEIEDVPNWYFKFEWINENEEIERGYLVSLKPKNNTFEFYKANENTIIE